MAIHTPWEGEWWSKWIFSTFHSYDTVAGIPEEPAEASCQALNSVAKHLDATAGPTWDQVSNIVIWLSCSRARSSSPGLSILGMFPIPIWPLRYSHCSQLMPLVGWGGPISAKVWLVFKYQPRKSILKISAADFIMLCMESLLLVKVKC